MKLLSVGCCGMSSTYAMLRVSLWHTPRWQQRNQCCHRHLSPQNVSRTPSRHAKRGAAACEKRSSQQAVHWPELPALDHGDDACDADRPERIPREARNGRRRVAGSSRPAVLVWMPDRAVLRGARPQASHAAYDDRIDRLLKSHKTLHFKEVRAIVQMYTRGQSHPCVVST